MAIVTFYNGAPKDAPKTTMPAHLGANAIITCKNRLLLEMLRTKDAALGLMEEQVKLLTNQVEWLKRQLFGRKSEPRKQWFLERSGETLSLKEGSR